jgi:hypothetical protein
MGAYVFKYSIISLPLPYSGVNNLLFLIKTVHLRLFSGLRF